MFARTEHRLRLLMSVAICAATSLISCAAPRSGPKRIEADGVTYIACGGALWFENEGDWRNPDARSYEVVFTDAQGRRHDLKRVRMLTVRDLPSDSKDCTPAK